MICISVAQAKNMTSVSFVCSVYNYFLGNFYLCPLFFKFTVHFSGRGLGKCTACGFLESCKKKKEREKEKERE